MTRTFEDKPAVRAAVPLLVGLVGPSSSGKTFSGLRLATGIQQVSGGEIYVVDTESRRALHHAGRFKFRHIEFSAPFGPLDYLAAIEHCIRKGAGVIVIDSASHEHEGPGGILDLHEKEVERLSGGNPSKAKNVSMLAWSKPKAERRRLINSMLQMNANFIFCFRAKEKLKPIPGSEPEHLGFMPISGDEWVYEMTVNLLLHPGSQGTPTLHSDFTGERAVLKIPEQFKSLFRDGQQLDENLGRAMAQWAAGDGTPQPASGIDANHLKALWSRTVPAFFPKEAWLEEMSRRWNSKSLGTLTVEQVREWEADLADWESPTPATTTDADYAPVEQEFI